MQLFALGYYIIDFYLIELYNLFGGEIMAKTLFNFVMEQELKEWLHQKAWDSHMSMSAYINMLLMREMERESKEKG